MKNTGSLVLIFLACLVAGCATQKTMVATGGSRSDGTVQLAYEYGMFEAPQVDLAAAQSTATARCAAWGYNGAEAFGSGQNSCAQTDGYGNCVRTRVTVVYQCLGTQQ